MENINANMVDDLFPFFLAAPFSYFLSPVLSLIVFPSSSTIHFFPFLSLKN